MSLYWLSLAHWIRNLVTGPWITDVPDHLAVAEFGHPNPRRESTPIADQAAAAVEHHDDLCAEFAREINYRLHDEINEWSQR